MLRALLLLVLSLTPRIGAADSSGVDSRPTFPPLGCGNSVTGENAGCHFQDANPEVMVSIQGPTQIDVGPEGFGIYTASMPPDTLGLLGAGINAAIDAPNESGCELDTFAPPAKMQLLNDDKNPSPDPLVSHRDDLDPPSPTLVGVWSYQFLVLNCAAPGPILLRVAMNAFNGDGGEDGEAWNSATLAVTVPETGSTLLGVGAVVALGAVGSLRRS